MTESGSDTAFVFPGQGSQRPGMGRTFYETWPETRATFDELDAALGPGVDLRSLCFDADAETLWATVRAQPAVFAVGVAAAHGVVTRTGLEPSVVAGHSLGHLTALAVSGMLDAASGVRLVRERGRRMAAAARESGEGVMLAVLLADPDIVEETCREYDDVVIAAFNAPAETVISGVSDAVEAVRATVDQRTRARFRELDTETAFHSPLVEPARKGFESVLEETDLSVGDVPVASDVSGAVYTEPQVARSELTEQVTATIDWVGTVRTLRERGITRYVELPPAGTLGPSIERIDPDATVVTVETPDDIETVEKWG